MFLSIKREKFMKKIIKCLLVLALLLLSGIGYSCTYAAPNVLTYSMASERSRAAYLMNGTDGKLYNIYIVGENENFYGRAMWRKTDYDQLYSADAYWAYVSESGDSVAMFQSVNLFGKKYADQKEYMNLTDPTYMSGVFVIPGTEGQPDVLVTAKQMTGGGFVDYRCFVIKNGELRQMKFMSDNKKTRLAVIGIHSEPYEVEDGTLAFPWFRQRQMDTPGGHFVSVYMPDFTNLILIHAYTYKG